MSSDVFYVIRDTSGPVHRICVRCSACYGVNIQSDRTTHGMLHRVTTNVLEACIVYDTFLERHAHETGQNCEHYLPALEEMARDTGLSISSEGRIKRLS